jgi:hypothetical protein
MMDYEFRWIPWNIAHIGEHGVTPAEAEYVITHARRPYPRRIVNEKYLVHGQSDAGRYLQVIFLLDAGDTVFVIHAMPLTPRQKHQFRRRQP